MKRLSMALVLAGLAMSAPLAATAQDEQPDAQVWSGMMMGSMAACPLGGAGGGMMNRAMGPGMMAHRDAGSVDAQLEASHGALAVTAEQEAAWTAYVEAARADAQARVDMHGRMAAFMQAGSGRATAWGRAHAEMMRTRAGSLEALTTAADALYAALDDAQKATFDRDGGGLCGMP